jgi:hypothetical protein
MSTLRLPSLNSLIFKSFFLRLFQRHQNEPARHQNDFTLALSCWRNEGGEMSNISFAT